MKEKKIRTSCIPYAESPCGNVGIATRISRARVLLLIRNNQKERSAFIFLLFMCGIILSQSYLSKQKEKYRIKVLQPVTHILII